MCVFSLIKIFIRMLIKFDQLWWLFQVITQLKVLLKGRYNPK